MNVFYISYIYKLATSSHAKPRLFEATSLTWLLAGSRVSPFRKSSYAAASDFMVSQIHDSGSSQVCDLRSFASPRLQIFTGSRLPSFAGSRFQIFISSRLRSFAGSRFQIFASSRFLKTHFTNFVKLNVSRVTGFPEFLHTSPSGKRVDSDDPIPRKS
jgi:hypothetical protein